jgi:lysophospholipase L1-like esterase
VLQRGSARIAAASTAAAAGAGCLALVITSSGTSQARAAPAAHHAPARPARPARPAQPATPIARPQQSTLASCEQRLEHSNGPRVVIVGASFTAGVGPGRPDRSWAAVLASDLHWNAVVYGVAGAGYVRPGAGRQGPVAAELGRIDLTAIAPSLVIVQAGHDDIGIPVKLERQRVAQVIALIHAEVPKARIALLTVFAGHAPLPAAHRTDQAIVAATTRADPHVIIMDPAGWRYQRSLDGLHPTTAGSGWLARTAAAILRRHGAQAGTAKAKTVLCYGSRTYPAGSRNRMRVPPPGRVSARMAPP